MYVWYWAGFLQRISWERLICHVARNHSWNDDSMVSRILTRDQSCAPGVCQVHWILTSSDRISEILAIPGTSFFKPKNIMSDPWGKPYAVTAEISRCGQRILWNFSVQHLEVDQVRIDSNLHSSDCSPCWLRWFMLIIGSHSTRSTLCSAPCLHQMACV